jgi:CRP/FNR family transcriptional regulator, cyclic AMP receptor protein
MEGMEDLPGLTNDLGKVRHFRNLSLRDLNRIVSAGKVQRYRANEILFQEEEPCAGMFVLLKGRIHLCKLGPQGQVNILAVIHPVIMFNEVAVLDGGPNPATAMAVEDSLTWRVSHEAFQSLIEAIPQVGLSLLRVLARRNRELISQYEDLSFRPVVSRMAKLLLDLSARGKVTINRRQCSLEEMAARIGSVPEAVSRALNVIKTNDCISVSRSEIQVLSPAGLAKLAHLELYAEE